MNKTDCRWIPTISLTTFFADRNYLGSLGVPQNAQPNSTLSYALNGPGERQADVVGT